MKRVFLAVLISTTAFYAKPDEERQQPPPHEETEPILEVKLEIGRQSGASLVLEAIATNSGKSAVYIVTGPERSDGSRGPSFYRSSSDSSLLICAFNFFEPSRFYPVIEHAGAHLLRLEPGQSHSERIQLDTPVRTTEPPFGGVPGTFPLDSLTRAKVNIGVFLASSELMELTKIKPKPHDMFTGVERVRLGQKKMPLYSAQRIAQSNTVEIHFEASDSPH